MVGFWELSLRSGQQFSLHIFQFAYRESVSVEQYKNMLLLLTLSVTINWQGYSTDFIVFVWFDADTALTHTKANTEEIMNIIVIFKQIFDEYNNIMHNR